MTLTPEQPLSRVRAFAGPSAIYFSTVVAAQVTSLVLLPIITRYLGPDAFGEYSLALAVTGLLGTIGSVWVRNVGLRLYFDHVADARTRTFFWTAALVQLGAMLGVLVVAYPIVRWSGQSIDMALYAAAGATVVVSDFYSLVVNTLRAGHRAVQFGAAEWTSSTMRLAIVWTGLALGLRSASMLFALTAASMLVASIVAASGLHHVLTGPARIDRSMARELVSLGLPSIPGSFGGWIIALSDRVLLAWFLDIRAVGIYSAAYGVADRAVNGLASGLFMSTGPAMLRRWSEVGESAARTITGYAALYIALSVGPCVLLVIQREFVVRLLTSEAYVSAASVVPWVVAGTWLGGLATYLGRPLEMTKRFSALSVLATAAAALNVGLNLVLIPSLGVVGAAVGTFGALAGLALLSRFAAQRALVVPFPWMTTGVAIAAAVAAGAAAVPITNAWLSIAVFVLVYFAGVALAWARVARLELHWI